MLPFNSAARRCVGCFAVAMGLLVTFSVGCQKEPDRPATNEKSQRETRPMRVMIVDDEPLATTLMREWKARIESPLEVEQRTTDQLASTKRIACDIVIYPAEYLGTLAEKKLIEPWPQEPLNTPTNSSRDVLENQRTAEVRWGKANYAVSFGSPQFVVIYRSDLFKQLQLTPPATWEDYMEVASRLSRAEIGDAAPSADRPWSAVIEPLAPGWAGKVLLARAAAYASHPAQFSVLFDYTTMEPLITGPPFVRALKELVASAELGPPEADKINPEAARRALLAGQAGMVISWPSRVTVDPDPVDIAPGVTVGFSELPGAASAYNFAERIWTDHDGDEPVRVPLMGIDGRLGSVTSSARRPTDAAGVLALLSDPQWSLRLSPQSAHTSMFRKSQFETAGNWIDAGLRAEAVEQYCEVVEKSQTRPTHVSTIRIPGWPDYLAALDGAVHAARAGSKSAEEALGEAAATWRGITKDHGVEAQRMAYTRSLGIEP